MGAGGQPNGVLPRGVAHGVGVWHARVLRRCGDGASSATVVAVPIVCVRFQIAAS